MAFKDRVQAMVIEFGEMETFETLLEGGYPLEVINEAFEALDLDAVFIDY